MNGYGEVSELSVGRWRSIGPGRTWWSMRRSCRRPGRSARRSGHDRAGDPGPARRRAVRRCGRQRRVRAPRPAGAVAPGPADRGRRRPRQRLEPDAQRHRRRRLPPAALAGAGHHRHPARGRDHDLAGAGCIPAVGDPRPSWPAPIGSGRPDRRRSHGALEPARLGADDPRGDGRDRGSPAGRVNGGISRWPGRRGLGHRPHDGAPPARGRGPGAISARGPGAWLRAAG